jgi:hypothetical protein
VSDDAPGTDQPEPEPEPRDHAEAGSPAGDERPTPSGPGAEGNTPDADDQGRTSNGRRTDGDRTPPPRPSNGYVCDICGSPMLERHCKILCPICGYQRDCSDP